MTSASFRCAIMLCLLFTGNTYGQFCRLPLEKVDTAFSTYLEQCGKDNDPLLSQSESRYLNVLFFARRHKYNFNNKTLAFVTGSRRKTISGKQAYFTAKQQNFQNIGLNNTRFFIFNENEKQQSGGYDAVIFYSSKLLVTKKGLLKLLHKQVPAIH